MVELRHHQRLVWEGWFPEQAQGWWEEWMRQADQVLDDDELLEAVYHAQGKRRPKSHCRGRKQTPAEVVLRLAVLKHVRNWSFEETEREVRANVVYRQFTRIGAEKVPDAKTLGRLMQALGPNSDPTGASATGCHSPRKEGRAGTQASPGYDGRGKKHSLPNGQQFAQRWRAGTDSHDEEDYGADRASGDEVAQPHAHDRASGDGDRADQPQQGTASAEKAEAGLPKAVDRDTQGRQPSEALPGGDRQRCEAH